MRQPQPLQTSCLFSVTANGQDRVSGLGAVKRETQALGPNVCPSLGWSLLLGRVKARLALGGEGDGGIYCQVNVLGENQVCS